MKQNEPIPEQVHETEESQEQLLSPYDLIASKGGPSKDTILAWKTQTPNGKLKVFTPDGGKRLFIMRAVSSLEMSLLSRQIPKNTEPEQRNSDLEMLVAAKCIVWTNITPTGKVQPDELKAGSAGLSSTLFNFIAWMSDYVDPSAFEVISSDL